MTMTITPALEKVFKTRALHVPAGARAIKHKKTPATVYLYETAAGAPCAVAFFNRQTKPYFRYRFRTEEERAAKVAGFFKRAEESAQHKAKTSTADNGSLEVGHILSDIWGYSMTIVDFYEVVGKRGRTIVQLRELAQEVVSGEPGYQGTVVPKPGEYVGEVIERRVTGSNGRPGVKICDVKRPSLWNGKPVYFNRMD